MAVGEMIANANDDGGRDQRILWLATFACAFALIAFDYWLFYPGLVTFDSIEQYREALSGRFTDTHPPLMAAVWRVLLPLSRDARPMLGLNLALYWGSFAALAIYGVRSTSQRQALFAVFAGLFPLLLSFSGVIWKDVTLAASWGLSCGLLLLSCSFRHKRRLFWAVWIASALLVIFGSAMRHNAPPAAIVLALALVQPLPVNRAARMLIFSAVATSTILAVPISVRALRATDMAPVQNLIKWDLVGISYFSRHDVQIDPPRQLRPNALSCYSARVNFCPSAHFRSTEEALSLWRYAIAREPIAYLKHRSLVFGMLLRFGCSRCHPYVWESGNQRNPPLLHYQPNRVRKLFGYAVFELGRTPIGRPYVWLVTAAAIALMLWRKRSVENFSILALIVLSGAVYALTYAVATVTDEFRYMYWLIYSVVLVGTAWLFSEKAAWRDLVLWVALPVAVAITADTLVQRISPTDTIAPSMAAIY